MPKHQRKAAAFGRCATATKYVDSSSNGIGLPLEPQKTPLNEMRPQPAQLSTVSASELGGHVSWRKLLIVAALLLGYAGFSYYSTSTPNARGLAVGLSIGPLLLIGLALTYRWVGALSTLLLAAAAAALLYCYLRVLETNVEWLDLVQQCGVYGLVAVSFGRSLLPRRVPLCTQLATKMHGALTPVEVLYTRRATLAWLIFYLALIVVIIALYLNQPLKIWSLFVNFGAIGLILLMGLGDHWLRARLLPPRPSGGLLAILHRALIG